jgi:hypothetical protein
MFIVSVLLIFFFVFKFLSKYIKQIRTGDPNENNSTYWMFSYDFESPNKNWSPENKQLLKKKRIRNFLIFILYLNVLIVFLLSNSFIVHLLNFILNPKFNYPI